MLYSIHQIQAKIAIMPEYAHNKVNLINFFNIKNIVENLGVSQIYCHDNLPGFFLEESAMNHVCQVAGDNFKQEVNHEGFYGGPKALLKIAKDEQTTAFKVTSLEDVERVQELHFQNSTYGKREQVQLEAKRLQKEKKMEIFQQEVDKRREQEKLEFHRSSNLLRDFYHDKVVSIDFEFFITPDNKHLPTELGISINHQGRVYSQHYLVNEHYMKKKKRHLQDKFMFGSTRVIAQQDIALIINKALQGTKYVVFHEKREDSEILNQMGISIHPEIDQLDTQQCYKRYFREKGSMPNGESLDNLLSMFKINYENLHNAGNDAYYTLVLLQTMSDVQKNVMKEKNTTRPRLK